jgi:hypothetical protein
VHLFDLNGGWMKMSEDYGFAGSRKSKGDKRAKGRYMKYKKGGKYRTVEFSRKEEERK